MGRGYFPVAKLQSYNQGKGWLLYPNNPVNLKANSRGWASTEKPKTRSKSNGISDLGVVEQNQGPRTACAKATLVSGGNDAGSLSADDGDGKRNCIASLMRRDQYELPDFPTKYDHAFFFVIKSYSEDDVHKSIKYNVCIAFCQICNPTSVRCGNCFPFQAYKNGPPSSSLITLLPST